MIIELRKVGHRGRDFNLPLPGDLLAAPGRRGGDSPALTRGKFEGRVEVKEGQPVLEATVEAEIQRTCVRCLEPSRQAVRESLMLVLVSPRSAEGVGEAEMDVDLSADLEVPEGRLDLLEVAREAIFLQLPQRPLCATDCKGLCPTCGVNRNGLECACVEGSLDLRMEPLRELLERKQRQKQEEEED